MAIEQIDMVLLRFTPTQIREIRLNGRLRGYVILTHIAERLTVQLSLPVLNVLGRSLIGFEHSAFLLREECSCRLRLRVSVFVHLGLSGMNTSKCIRFVT